MQNYGDLAYDVMPQMRFNKNVTFFLPNDYLTKA